MNKLEIEKICTPDVLEAIRTAIGIELLKRGFTAPITLGLKNARPADDSGEWYITLESEPFQTTPVLFREIQVQHFSSTLRQDTSPEANEARTERGWDSWKVWISVNARWEVFSGGSNGTTLFDFTCLFKAGDEGSGVRIYDIGVK